MRICTGCSGARCAARGARRAARGAPARRPDAARSRGAQCVVRSLLKHMQLGTPAKGTFAHMLLRVKDPATGQPLSDKQMLPEIAALYFAGIDTTGAPRPKPPPARAVRACMRAAPSALPRAFCRPWLRHARSPQLRGRCMRCALLRSVC
jgi:hypothetical protein